VDPRTADALAEHPASRLVHELQARVAGFLAGTPAHRLLLVSSPAGAGKTTAALATLLRLGAEDRVRSVYLTGSKYETIEGNLGRAVEVAGVRVERGRHFEVVRASWRRAAGQERMLAAQDAPLLLAHTRHIYDTNAWDVQPGDRALLRDRAIVVFDESPVEAFRQRFRVPHSDLRRLRRMLANPRLRRRAVLALLPEPRTDGEETMAMHCRHALATVRASIDMLYREGDTFWLGKDRGVPPGVIPPSLPAREFRRLLFTLFTVAGAFGQEGRERLADLFRFLIDGGVLQGEFDRRDRLCLVGRRDLRGFRSALPHGFRGMILDATGHAAEYTRPDRDGDSWVTAERSMLRGCGAPELLEIRDDRPQRATCELVLPDTGEPHTLRSVRRVGRGMRTRLRRGIAAYVRSFFGRRQRGKMAVLATGPFLSWLYGRYGDRYGSDGWASDPREAARRGIRMAVGAHPDRGPPEIRVEYLHGVRGSNELKDFGALLVVMPAFAPRPVESTELGLWEDKERRAFQQAIERLRARDRNHADPPELVLWGTGRDAGDLREWGYEDIREHGCFDAFLSAHDEGARRAGRGIAVSSRILHAVAPDRPFAIDELRVELEVALAHDDDQLLAAFEGLEGLNDEDFEKGILKSALRDLGIAPDGSALVGQHRLDRRRHVLSSDAQRVLDEIRTKISYVLREVPYPVGWRIDPEGLGNVQEIGCARWEALAPCALRTLILELLVRLERLPRGRWHRLIHDALGAAGFVILADGRYVRPFARIEEDPVLHGTPGESTVPSHGGTRGDRHGITRGTEVM